MSKVSGALNHAHEYVLREIFGQARGVNLPENEVVNRGFVPANEDSEGCTVAALVAQHQSFVGHLLATVGH